MNETELSFTQDPSKEAEAQNLITEKIDSIKDLRQTAKQNRLLARQKN